jgi:asparagine synthase (glutamine-hydrolysing)
VCGICGIVDLDATANSEVVRAMTSQLTHRGPDADGFFFDGPIGLGFRRLRIIDLNTGDQPMANETGSVQVVFNGEIYNFQHLRRSLEAKGHVFRTQSDTETITHAYEEYSERCVDHFRGMFAIAVWDAECRRLFLARDRLGKKPLYYYKDEHRLVFASELKALLRCPQVPRKVNPSAVDHYLRDGYISAPSSILTNVFKLPPAHWLTFDLETRALRVCSYWTPQYAPKSTATFEDTAAELRQLLSEAVRLRLVSDVPLGALLSGGIDSSIVVGLMAQHASRPVKTFSIGFEENDFNELPYAREIARQFGTEHHEMIVRPRAADVLPQVVWHLDEPMADASALPSYYVAQMARQHVTVVLNGDGGDEAFAGYNRHGAVMAYQRYQSLPGWVRHGLIEVLLKAAPTGQPTDHPLSRARRLVAQSAQSLEHQYSRWMSLSSVETRRSLYTDDFAGLMGNGAFEVKWDKADHQLGPLDWMLRSDTLNYLPGDLLVKMDRMTMAHSLEARSPLLDQEVVEFAARLPEAYKRKGRIGKRILKEAFRQFLPSDLVSRPKRGFSVPVDRWLRNGMKSMAAEIVLSRSARQRGLFNTTSVSCLWNEHQEGRHNHGDQLWALLVLELWMRQFLDVPEPTGFPV